MAPPDFPVHLEADRSRKNEGTATKEEMSVAIRNFQRHQGNNPDSINTEYAMNALETLGVMFELPDRPGVFCIPSRLPRKDRNEMWPDNPRKPAYVGRRIQCLRDIDIFTSAFFVFFQSRLAVTVDRKAFLWKGGIKVAHVIKEEAIECLVELKNYDTVVDLVARGSEKSRRHCLAFLETVNDILVQLLTTKSPGTRTRRYLLHPPDLAARAVEPFGFTEEEVENARHAELQVVVSTNESNSQFVEASLDELMACADDQCEASPSHSRRHTAADEQPLPASLPSYETTAANEQLQVTGSQAALAIATTKLPQPRSSPSNGDAAAERRLQPLSSLFSVQTVDDETQPSSPCPGDASLDEQLEPVSSVSTTETTERQLGTGFVSPLLRAVLKRAPHRWFALAVAMGFEEGQITDICYDKGSFSDKLHAIFLRKRAEVGLDEAELALKVACQEIEPPVYGAVLDELEKNR